MDSSITIRPVFGRVLTIVVIAIVTAAALSTVLSSPPAVLRGVWLPLLLAYVAWLTMWRPLVSIDEDGVTVRNVFSTARIPWNAIQRIDTKWALTLYTAQGRHVAWAAPAPGRHLSASFGSSDLRHLPGSAYSGGSVRAGDLPRSDSGDAATIIRTRWEAIRDGSSIVSARSATGVTVRPHTRQIVVLAVLVLSVIGRAAL